MDPPSSASVLSSLLCPSRVNAQPDVPLCELVRRVLRAERRIRTDRPAPPPPAARPKPAQADQVLELVAGAYKPGDRVGRHQVAAAAGIAPSTAGFIRQWAIAEGRWPYRDALGGWAAYRARKGGAQ